MSSPASLSTAQTWSSWSRAEEKSSDIARDFAEMVSPFSPFFLTLQKCISFICPVDSFLFMPFYAHLSAAPHGLQVQIVVKY